MPGQPRWPLLAPFADSAPISARAAGHLYATPYGWPAAVFAAGRDTIPGLVIHLLDGTNATALRRLDEIEGVEADLFRRVAITTTCGRRCFAYDWPHAIDGFVQIPAWSARGTPTLGS